MTALPKKLKVKNLLKLLICHIKHSVVPYKLRLNGKFAVNSYMNDKLLTDNLIVGHKCQNYVSGFLVNILQYELK